MKELLIFVTGAGNGSICHREEAGMLKAAKGNRVVRIPDEKKDAYITMGYKISTMDGKVLHEPVNAVKEVERLKEKVAELEKKLDEERCEAERLREASAVKVDVNDADVKAAIAETSEKKTSKASAKKAE